MTEDILNENSEINRSEETLGVTTVVPEKKAKRTVSFIGRNKADEKSAPKKFVKPRRAVSDMEERVLAVRRVARVVAGGRRFNFSVLLAAGDRKGRVGVGLGKGADTSLAMAKALKQAKRLLIKVNLTKEKSIPREVFAKYSSASVYIKPALGRGLIAGSAVRSILLLAGITDVNAKVLSRSKNKLNIARATIEALKKI